MKKFHEIYKQKQNKATELFETRVLGEFKSVYNTLLGKYRTSDFYTLNEEEQVTFLTELNSYWTEEEGLSEKGKKFLQTRSDVLAETSTTLQKKNFFKGKTSVMINETLRLTDLKWKLYDIIDEMYNETRAKAINDVLSPETITDIIKESLNNYVDNFVNEIRLELSESAKEVEEKIKEQKSIIFPANSKLVKDKKDHFIVRNDSQAKTAMERINEYKAAPSWYAGSLDSLVKKVTVEVKKRYPNI